MLRDRQEKTPASRVAHQFLEAVRPVMDCIEANDFEGARARFNDRVFPAFGKYTSTDEECLFATFLLDLDSYLNNKVWRELFRQISRETILDRYHNELLPDIAAS